MPGGVAQNALDRMLQLARADLAGDLARCDEPDLLLAQLLRRVRALVPAADAASIFVPELAEQPGTGGPSVASGALAEACDLLQQQLGTGPALAAMAAGGTVRVVEVSTDPRWPEFAARAAGLGVGSLVACALPGPGPAVGALTLCAARPAAFDVVACTVAAVLANRAAIVLAHADKVRHLYRAIDSRQVIGQATGILIERHKLRPEQAFELLVRASQRRHVKLRELAELVVETGEEPDPRAAARPQQATFSPIPPAPSRRSAPAWRSPRPG